MTPRPASLSRFAARLLAITRRSGRTFTGIASNSLHRNVFHSASKEPKPLAFLSEPPTELRSWKSPRVSGSFVRVPRKIRQLVIDLEGAGFARIAGGKGSHRKFVHTRFRGFVLVSGHDGDDAQHYQEKQVRNALRKVLA